MDPLLNSSQVTNIITKRYKEEKNIVFPNKVKSTTYNTKIDLSMKKFQQLLKVAYAEARKDVGQYHVVKYEKEKYLARIKIKNNGERLQVYKSVKYLNQGSYAKVEKYLKVHTGNHCAIKILLTPEEKETAKLAKQKESKAPVTKVKTPENKPLVAQLNEKLEASNSKVEEKAEKVEEKGIKKDTLENEIEALNNFNNKLNNNTNALSILPDKHIPFLAPVKNPVGKHPESQMEMAIFELAEFNLVNYINKNPTISVADILQMATDMFNALLILEDLEVLHPDIKPENFLVFGEASKRRLKLGDFSGVKDFPPANEEEYEGRKVHFHSPAYIKMEIVEQSNTSKTNNQFRSIFKLRQRTSIAMSLFELLVFETDRSGARYKQVVENSQKNSNNSKKDAAITKDEKGNENPKKTTGTTYDFTKTPEFSQLPSATRAFLYDLVDPSLPSIKGFSQHFKFDLKNPLVTFINDKLMHLVTEASGF